MEQRSRRQTIREELQRNILQGLLYAFMSAAVILGVAFFLSQGSMQARDLAYREIHEHRLSFVCWKADVAEAVNAMLEEVGSDHRLEDSGTNGIDCSELSEPTESLEPEQSIP